MSALPTINPGSDFADEAYLACQQGRADQRQQQSAAAQIALLHGLKGELMDAFRPFVDCNFTYFSGKVLGSDSRLTREQVECARAVIAKAEKE